MKTTEAKTKKEKGRIPKIEEGMVIDHIPSGCALKVLEILGIHPGTKAEISFAMNVPSSTLEGGTKDIVKIEYRKYKSKELKKSEIDKITVIAHNATINIIKNFEVVKKYQVSLPYEIVDIITCPNPNCATNHQKETGHNATTFKVISKKPVAIECYYCETVIKSDNVPKYIKC